MEPWFKKPSTTGGVGYLIALALAVIGIGLAAADRWRIGMTTFGVAFVFALLMRAILPDDAAGMLRVRRRLVDLVFLALCAGGILVLTIAVPTGR
jgi:DUF3017 family protein